MLFRLINPINREQELAAPMVISYLMGRCYLISLILTSLLVIIFSCFVEIIC